MTEKEMLYWLAEIEAELDRWKAESDDPHTLISCDDAIRFVRHAYDTVKDELS